MKKIEKIKLEIAKEYTNQINKHICYSIESFYQDCYRYKKACKEGTIICNIASVSKSGMSRTIKFLNCEKNKSYKKEIVFNYCSFYSFFCVLGFQQIKRSNYFKINGCGMDMIFDTNYRIIKSLQKLGICTKEESEILCQKTPTII